MNSAIHPSIIVHVGCRYSVADIKLARSLHEMLMMIVKESWVHMTDSKYQAKPNPLALSSAICSFSFMTAFPL